MIGSELAGYKVTAKIKDGSVGIIYKATKGGVVYALKILRAQFVSESVKLHDFRREAKIARMFSHQNIIRVYDYREEQPAPFMVMEYFESENLKEALTSKKELLQQKMFTLFRQCAEALASIHAQSVVHRDVKPDNFLVNAKGEVKLIDFSIALTKLDRLNPFSRPRNAGTLKYMSPEQITNSGVDCSSDIYSLGIMMFEMLTGRVPFDGKSTNDVFDKQLKDAAPSLRTFNPGVFEGLDSLVMKMLSKNPKERPDAKMVSYELRKWEMERTVIRKKQIKWKEDKPNA